MHKKYEVILILYSFTPSGINFQTNLMPKVVSGKILSEKNWSFGTCFKGENIGYIFHSNVMKTCNDFDTFWRFLNPFGYKIS